MDRRKFLNSLSVASVATITGAATLTEKADALEDAMDDGRPAYDSDDERPYLQHYDPLLP